MTWGAEPTTNWVGPGERGWRLVRPAEVRPGGVEAAVRRCIDSARDDRLDRVVIFTADDDRDAAETVGGMGFSRLAWRDHQASDGSDVLAYVLDLAPVAVRPAEPAEFDRAGRVTLAGYVADGVLESTDGYADQLTDAAARASEATLLVAVDAAGAVVGTVTFCRPDSSYAELSGPGEAEFRMLAVDPGARGSGVGAALVHACLDRAGAAGDHRVVLSTLAEMRAAARLYDRLGFVAVPARDWSPAPGVDLLAYQRDVRVTR